MLPGMESQACRRCICGGDALAIIGTGRNKRCRNAECVAERKRLAEQRLAPKRGLPRPRQNYSCSCPSPLCKNRECRALRVRQREEKRAAKLAALEQKRQAKALAREGKRERQLAKANARYRAKIAGRPCTCGPGQRCWNSECKKKRKLKERQLAADRKADEINQAAIAAGAEYSKHRPLVIGVCACGAAIFGQHGRFGKCYRCSLIARTKKDVSKYFGGLTESEATARRLYQPIPDAEVEILAMCDTESAAQTAMDAVIRRECARIRENWSEETHHERAGLIIEHDAPVQECRDSTIAGTSRFFKSY